MLLYFNIVDLEASFLSLRNVKTLKKLNGDLPIQVAHKLSKDQITK